MSEQAVRIIIAVLWFIAFFCQFAVVWNYPKSQQKERFWLSLIMLSYIFHVIFFYALVILRVAGQIDKYLIHDIMDWSRVLRIHGAIAIISKEIVTIVKLKKLKKYELRH